ncbi:MAG: toprim domain-containing protein [Candidatus Bathyarchaeia archaeon]|nr:toprim domain-containing protein [Candidatus Bathyarchaeota archaeon]
MRVAVVCLERKLEKLNYLIERLKDEVSAGALLIVEGEKDIVSLRAIGIKDNIVAVKSGGKTLQEIIDEISLSDREIILLTDFDRRGRELAIRLCRSFEGMRVKVNLRFWRELCGLLGNDIKDIEGLAVYLKNLRKKVEKDIFND